MADTAFQSNAFQSNAFQIYGGILGSDVNAAINSTLAGCTGGPVLFIDASRVEIGGGVQKHKSAKEERGAFIAEVIREVLEPAEPAPELPIPLRPVLQVRPVLVYKRPETPLSTPEIIPIPEENDEETISALIALGLF